MNTNDVISVEVATSAQVAFPMNKVGVGGCGQLGKKAWKWSNAAIQSLKDFEQNKFWPF